MNEKIIITKFLHHLGRGYVTVQGDEDVAGLDVEVDKLLAVDVLEPLGHVAQDPPQLALGESLFPSPVILNLRLQASALAILILDENLEKRKFVKTDPCFRKLRMTHHSFLDPTVVISDDVLVLHQGGVGEHLVHGHLLVVAVLPDFLLGDLDGIDHPVKTMSGLLDKAKLSTGYHGQLEKFLFIPCKIKKC